MSNKPKINVRHLARKLSLVENHTSEGDAILANLTFPYQNQIIGITGPPGAGKSSIVNRLIEQMLNRGKRIAIIAVDPSSPFNHGSVLGDRIRMNQHFNNEQVYIRSVASRGALGGLSPQIIEMVDVLRNEPFDYVIIETVGVGQSEIDIAGLAETTIVALVPESGDTIQTMKAGILEIADIFVVNKADRENADDLQLVLKRMLHELPQADWTIPVIPTIATLNSGIDELFSNIQEHKKQTIAAPKKVYLLAQKLYTLISKNRMKDIDPKELIKEIEQMDLYSFNIYTFAKRYSDTE